MPPEQNGLCGTSTTWMAFISFGIFLGSMFDIVLEYNVHRVGVVVKERVIISMVEKHYVMRGLRFVGDSDVNAEMVTTN